MGVEQTLKVSASGQDYIFTENPDVVAYLSRLYPRLTFETSLSLSSWPKYRNLHTLSVGYPYSLDVKFNHPQVANAILESLLDFMDAVQEDMYRIINHTSAKVILSRIDVGTYLDPISMKSKIFAHLRAVFIPE